MALSGKVSTLNNKKLKITVKNSKRVVVFCSICMENKNFNFFHHFSNALHQDCVQLWKLEKFSSIEHYVLEKWPIVA